MLLQMTINCGYKQRFGSWTKDLGFGVFPGRAVLGGSTRDLDGTWGRSGEGGVMATCTGFGSEEL